MNNNLLEIANEVKEATLNETLNNLKGKNVIYVKHHKCDNPLFKTKPVNKPKNVVYIDYKGRFETLNGDILKIDRQSIYFDDEDYAVSLYEIKENQEATEINNANINMKKRAKND